MMDEHHIGRAYVVLYCMGGATLILFGVAIGQLL